MAEAPATGEQPAPGTGEGNTPPPATPPADPPATNEDETVTVKKSDYDNLVSQRDRANEAAKSAKGQEAFVEQLAQERSIKEFLKDNKKDFPDLKPSDLAHVWDPDQIKPEAERLQRRLQDHAQARLDSIEQTTAPVLSPQERAEKLAQLKKNPGPKAFDAMVGVKMGA